MKKLYFLIVFISITSSAFSQAYKPMLKENKIWDVSRFYQASIDWLQGARWYNSYFLEGDTIVDGIQYYKMQDRKAISYPYTGLLPTAFVYDSIYSFSTLLLREDTITRKVFSRNIYDTTEFILYDFSLTVGDTMSTPNYGYFGLSPAMTNQSINAVIDSIGLITLNNGEITRAFYVSPINFGTLHQPFYVIEGIGSLNGFSNPFENEFEETIDLMCVNDSGINLYISSFSCCFQCGTILSVKDNTVGITQLSIYPNPNDGGIITITGKELSTVNIYSIHGQLIKTINVNKDEISVSLANHPKGIYFVKAKFKNGAKLTKKLFLTR